jgi:hypothetical protein
MVPIVSAWVCIERILNGRAGRVAFGAVHRQQIRRRRVEAIEVVEAADQVLALDPLAQHGQVLVGDGEVVVGRRAVQGCGERRGDRHAGVVALQVQQELLLERLLAEHQRVERRVDGLGLQAVVLADLVVLEVLEGGPEAHGHDGQAAGQTELGQEGEFGEARVHRGGGAQSGAERRGRKSGGGPP